MVKLITWEMDRSHAPADPAERIKLTLTMLDMVKKSVESGQMKMWGINPGGNHGFALTDKDEVEVFGMVARYIPHVKFRVESMLSVDEVMAGVKAMQKQP